MKLFSQKKYFYFIVSFIFLYSYFFPRFLTQVFELDSPWMSYFYHYGFGLLAFLAGLLVILKFKTIFVDEKKWIMLLHFGFLYFALIHLSLILLAIYLPYKGL